MNWQVWLIMLDKFWSCYLLLSWMLYCWILKLMGSKMELNQLIVLINCD